MVDENIRSPLKDKKNLETYLGKNRETHGMAV